MLDTAEVWLLVCRTFFSFLPSAFHSMPKAKGALPYNASILTAITVRISFVCVVLILVITHINSDSNRYDGRGSLRPSYGKNSDASMLAHFNILFYCLSFVWIRMENLTGLFFQATYFLPLVLTGLHFSASQTFPQMTCVFFSSLCRATDKTAMCHVYS